MTRHYRLTIKVVTIAVLLAVLSQTTALSQEQTALAPNSLLGPELQISLPTSPEADRYRPAVAYNSNRQQFLVAWHNVWPDGHRDIYARRMSQTGQLLSCFSVSSGPHDRLQPDVVYNYLNDEYLVVWMYNANGDGTTYEIWGRVVSWDGSSMGPEFQIISWPNRTFWTPRAAYNGWRNEYLVVWTALDAASFTVTDVACRRLAADGTVLSANLISTTDTPHQADVTFNWYSNEYLVVWRRMWSPGDGDIFAARVNGVDGNVVTPPGEFAIAAQSVDQRSPAVSTNGNRYIVVWQEMYAGPCCDWDIHGRQLTANGGFVGDQIAFALSTEDESNPGVAAANRSDADYMIVWEQTSTTGSEIRAIRWTENQGYGAPVTLCQAAFWNCAGPAVIYGRPSFFFVYEGDSAGDPNIYRHVYGRLYTAYTAFLPLVRR